MEEAEGRRFEMIIPGLTREGDSLAADRLAL
jgi:hypothetical protein